MEELYRAIASLIGVCDGAVTRDMQGFNQADWHPARQAHDAFSNNSNTPLMDWVSWSMLRKYTVQLSGFGINYDNLPEPPLPIELANTDPTQRERTGRQILQGIRQEERAQERERQRREEEASSRRIEKVDNLFHIFFQKNFLIIEEIRRLHKSKFNWDPPYWHAPVTKTNILSLRQIAADYSFELSEEVARLFESGDSFEDPEPPKPKKTAELVGDTVIFRFDYDASILPDIRAASGRWNPEEKVWKAPASVNNAQALKDIIETHGFEASQELHTLLGSILDTALQNIQESTAEESDFQVREGLGGVLRPFQRAGVKYLVRNTSSFLADDMGLGKTIQALALLWHTEGFPAVVVCPAGLRLNWAKEAKKWLPGVDVGIFPNRVPQEGITIVSYASLKKYVKVTEGSQKPKVAIFDESQYLKNGKAQRSKAAAELIGVGMLDKVERVYMLTGTAVLNRPIEFPNQLELMGKLKDFGGFFPFAKRYCGAFKTRFGWDFSGASNTEELAEKLRAVGYIRRTKEEVLKELPPKQRTTITVPINNRKEYNQAQQNLFSYLNNQEISPDDIKRFAKAKKFSKEDLDELEDEGKLERLVSSFKASGARSNAAELVLITNLKRIAAEGKVKATVDWVKDFLDSGEKLVVFAHHRSVINSLATELEKVVGYPIPKITGSQKDYEKQQAVDDFQEGDAKVILVSLKAGGLGLTLTAASNVLTLELGWNPALHNQCEDRCNRIGQKNAVNCWYLLAEDTIDSDTWELIESKRQIIDAILDGKISEEKVSILNELMNRMRQKAQA